MLKARTWLGLVLLLPALGAGDPAKDRIRRFSSLTSSKIATERIDAILELSKADDPRIVETLFSNVFQDDDFRVAEAGVRFLARTGTSEALDWMKANGPAHRKPQVRFYTLRTLETLKEPPSAKIVEPFARDEHWVIRLEAAGALARTPDEAAVPLLRALLSDPMDPVRGSAILGLADHKAMDYLPDIRKALSDKDWRVRSSALEAVEILKDYGAIPQMQEALKRETELRMIDDLEQALFRMGVSRKAEQEEQLKEEARLANPAPGATEEVFTHPHAEEIDYGPRLKELKTLSRRIAYLFDCSQSMADTVHEHPEAEAPGKAKPKANDRYEVNGEGDPKKPKARSDEEAMGYDRAKQLEKEKNESFPPTKLGFCQREICRAIRQLRPETSFNVIGFRGAGKQMPWKGAYNQASPESINKAVTFTKMQTPGGETAAYDALVLALGFQEHDLFRQSANWDPKSWPDTILLFSDGRPTDGFIVQDEEFEASVRRLYRICRTRIHTVGVGRGDLHLLEHIAQITGGRFIQIADIE